MTPIDAARTELAPTLVAVDDAIDEVILRDLETTIQAIGSLLDRGAPRSTATGETDGFDGIDRRGDLDHLLPTEWLLVGEAPDEFLRRYDRRELSYFRRRRIQTRASPSSLRRVRHRPAHSSEGRASPTSPCSSCSPAAASQQELRFDGARSRPPTADRSQRPRSPT